MGLTIGIEVSPLPLVYILQCRFLFSGSSYVTNLAVYSCRYPLICKILVLLLYYDLVVGL